MAKLILSVDGQVLKEHTLAKERTLIGRKPHNDIQIDNLAVSGEHAAIITRNPAKAAAAPAAAPAPAPAAAAATAEKGMGDTHTNIKPLAPEQARPAPAAAPAAAPAPAPAPPPRPAAAPAAAPGPAAG